MPPGERGEICLRARSNPHYPLGYWNRARGRARRRSAASGSTRRTPRAMDEDGYVWYDGPRRRRDHLGRATGSARSRSSRRASSTRRSREAAAVASPDELRGNVVKAFVVLAAGHEPSDELADEIKALRPRAPLGVRLSARDRVRRRPAEDADRQDPPHRAAPARARALRRAELAGGRGSPPRAAHDVKRRQHRPGETDDQQHDAEDPQDDPVGVRDDDLGSTGRQSRHDDRPLHRAAGRGVPARRSASCA